MQLIDENGNLFGVLNVIDALIVLVLLAVVVAGVAFVTMGGDGDSGPDGEPVTRYATLELGQQPDYVIERLEEGDSGTVGNTDTNLTVTEIAHPSATGESELTIRVELEGMLRETDRGEERFHIADQPLQLGRDLGLNMGAYTTNGTVVDVGTEPDLPSEVTTTTVELELRNVDPSTGDGLEEGTTATTHGETVATLEEIEREPAVVVLQSDDGELHEREHPRNEDVTLTVALRTVRTGDGLYYGSKRIRTGQQLALEFDTATVSGEISRLE